MVTTTKTSKKKNRKILLQCQTRVFALHEISWIILFKFLFRYIVCLIYLEMSLEDDTVLCIEVEDDSSFLWND